MDYGNALTTELPHPSDNDQGLQPRLQRILFWSRSGASKALFKRVKIWSQRSMQKTFQILYLKVFRHEPNSTALNAIFFYFISSRDRLWWQLKWQRIGLWIESSQVGFPLPLGARLFSLFFLFSFLSFDQWSLVEVQHYWFSTFIEKILAMPSSGKLV